MNPLEEEQPLSLEKGSRRLGSHRGMWAWTSSNDALESLEG